jgi:hypothetical protein
MGGFLGKVASEVIRHAHLRLVVTARHRPGRVDGQEVNSRQAVATVVDKPNDCGGAIA